MVDEEALDKQFGSGLGVRVKSWDNRDKKLPLLLGDLNMGATPNDLFFKAPLILLLRSGPCLILNPAQPVRIEPDAF